MLNARVILDSGSQRTYVTTFIQGTMRLKTLCTETMVIEGGKTDMRCCGLVTRDSEPLNLSAVVIPLMLCLFSQLCFQEKFTGISLCKSWLICLKLEMISTLTFISCDYYWTLVSGRALSGPTAIDT